MELDSAERDLGVCCGSFYNNPHVGKLLDGIFHPGGLALSRLMTTKMGLDVDSVVLDIACGDGRTATYLARAIGCFVLGIDASDDMIQAALQRARDVRIEEKTDFRVAVAGKIPLEANSFTHALSECALCTFLDKVAAVEEISRVLQPGGVFGLNDVTLEQPNRLDDELRGLLGKVACVADALSSGKYVELFESRGFRLLDSSKHSSLLEEMTRKAEGRARFLMDLGTNDEKTKMSDALRIIGLINQQISTGNLGYEMFIFQLD
ncbi:MAG: class I SAM-dependent methyltransferase [Candidatus Thorarchaeota archaeon]